VTRLRSSVSVLETDLVGESVRDCARHSLEPCVRPGVIAGPQLDMHEQNDGVQEQAPTAEMLLALRADDNEEQEMQEQEMQEQEQEMQEIQQPQASDAKICLVDGEVTFPKALQQRFNTIKSKLSTFAWDSNTEVAVLVRQRRTAKIGTYMFGERGPLAQCLSEQGNVVQYIGYVCTRALMDMFALPPNPSVKELRSYTRRCLDDVVDPSEAQDVGPSFH